MREVDWRVKVVLIAYTAAWKEKSALTEDIVKARRRLMNASRVYAGFSLARIIICQSKK
jgi:hypothetical protein